MQQSPSLRGSGLKSTKSPLKICAPRRLPLYEGVDWNNWICEFRCKPNQSLPLYEGVDWNRKGTYPFPQRDVSLFTREWIEIVVRFAISATITSPSLRGSGLKWLFPRAKTKQQRPSPSLRGSGLKCLLCRQFPERIQGLPLYEGVDWNLLLNKRKQMRTKVSLFTREWIEMVLGRGDGFVQRQSPSLRGSGLK